MDSVLCIPGKKMGVILSERDHHSAWSNVNMGGLPLLFLFFIYSGPCVLAPVFLLRLWKHYKAPIINTLLRMWGHSNVTSQGASSLESLEDQQTLELWVNGYWEGAEKRKYGPCAPWAPWWASLGVCLIAGEFVLPSFHRHSDLKGAISVLIQIIW